MQRRKKILIAPLDWGLGHASRCVPIIRELLQQDTEVIVAGHGRSLALLRKEFPFLRWISLPGYEMKYHRRGFLVRHFIFQLPKILFSLIREHSMMRKIIREEKPDAIISDNRPGLYSRKVPSVFITHQIFIVAPKGLKWLEKLFTGINEWFIGKFDECWIPDFESEEENLSGKLSHGNPLPDNAIYINPLSRFRNEEMNKKYDLLIVLSGPEPQREILENILTEQITQLKNQSLKVLMVRGISERNQKTWISDQFSKIDFMGAERLNDAFLSSNIILSRSGYTTVMDVVKLGKKAIFIPTPGQTEQEYLAGYFKEKRIFYSETQSEFNLERALYESKKYSGWRTGTDHPEILKERIEKLLQSPAIALEPQIAI